MVTPTALPTSVGDRLAGAGCSEVELADEDLEDAAEPDEVAEHGRDVEVQLRGALVRSGSPCCARCWCAGLPGGRPRCRRASRRGTTRRAGRHERRQPSDEEGHHTRGILVEREGRRAYRTRRSIVSTIIAFGWGGHPGPSMRAPGTLPSPAPQDSLPVRAGFDLLGGCLGSSPVEVVPEHVRRQRGVLNVLDALGRCRHLRELEDRHQ